MYPVLFHIGPIFIPAFGVMSALGVLLGLFLAQHTARVVGLNTGKVWNLCVAGLFSALIVQRLLLVLLNWSEMLLHPRWMLTLSTIHHPLLTGAGAVAGVSVAAIYALRSWMPLSTIADALSAPLALGLAFEQLGALLAGSGYGTETAVRWAVTYTSPLAARWSGTPLGIPLHPVQAYAALGFLTLSLILLLSLPARRQQGDAAGLWLLGAGVVIFMTELWRDTEGRGTLLGGALDGPQAAAILFVLAGAFVLMEREGRIEDRGFPPIRQKEDEWMGHGEFEESLPEKVRAKDEAKHG